MSRLSKSDIARRNGSRSRGPVTAAGKAKSSRNSLKHGFCSRSAHVPDEQRKAYRKLEAELLEAVQPEGPIEDELFGQLLHAAWNLRRLRLWENQIASRASNPFDDDELSLKLERIERHKSRHQRDFNRALDRLQRLHTERAILVQQPRVAQSVVDAVGPLAAVSKLTKRTDVAFHPKADRFVEDMLEERRNGEGKEEEAQVP